MPTLAPDYYKVRRAMRANLGRVAVVVLLSVCLCGCKTGSNMFAWGKKKPASNSLTEAPPYKSTNPALPSTGQTPGGTQTSLPGSGLASAGASANPSAASATGFGATPAGYSQTPYPTTPYSQTKLGAASAPGTSAPATSPATASSAPSGYAAAVGTGNPLPPPVGYSPGTTNAAGATQPQNGFYNPSYGGVGSNSSPTPYASAAASNPAYNYNAMPSGSSAPSASAASVVPEYRMADARGVQAGAPANSPVMVSGVTSAAPPAANASVGDRYNNMNSGAVGDRYSAPAASPSAPPNVAPMNAAPPTTVSPMPGSAPPPGAYPSASSAPAASSAPIIMNAPQTPALTVAAPTSAPPSTVGDRYSQPAVIENRTTNGNEYASSGVMPAAASAPAMMSNPTAGESMPLRKDSAYRPGGTSDYTPGGNVLRPSADGGNGPQSDPSASPQGNGVSPASYRTSAASPVPTKPVVIPVSANQPIDERYGAYQGGAPAAEPAYGASAPAELQPAPAAQQHSW